MKNRRINKKQLFAIMIGMQLVGLGLLFWDMWQSTWGFQNRLERNKPGQGNYTEEMEVDGESYSGNYIVEVEERHFSEEEAEKLFRSAKKEIDREFLGRNKDTEHVMYDVVIRKKYQEGKVKAEWNFDDGTRINTEGKIQMEEVKKPVIIQASVQLKCQDRESVYSFPFRVIPVPKNSKEGFLLEVKKQIQKNSTDNQKLKLPTKINGQVVKWKKKKSLRGVWLMVLGLSLPVIVFYGQKVEKKRDDERRKKILQQDYPLIVDQMSLLLGVGISFSEAVSKICTRYERGRRHGEKSREGYELLTQMNWEMRDGVSEIMALEHFGRRAEIKEYRKLALLLEQYQRKGNAQVREQLENENINAFEMRKLTAKKLGEEASTKLLFPMMGMLAMVLVIIVIPALMKVKIT